VTVCAYGVDTDGAVRARLMLFAAVSLPVVDAMEREAARSDGSVMPTSSRWNPQVFQHDKAR
jgi:hypothetical protein